MADFSKAPLAFAFQVHRRPQRRLGQHQRRRVRPQVHRRRRPGLRERALQRDGGDFQKLVLFGTLK